MQDINSVAMTGNLTRDPELRSLSSGTSVCLMRIASNTGRKVNGEWQDKPNYFDVIVWGGRGESAAKYLSKASRVAIQGCLEWHEYELASGSKRQIVQIVATTVRFLSNPPASESAQLPLVEDLAALVDPPADDDIPF